MGSRVFKSAWELCRPLELMAQSSSELSCIKKKKNYSCVNKQMKGNRNNWYFSLTQFPPFGTGWHTQCFSSPTFLLSVVEMITLAILACKLWLSNTMNIFLKYCFLLTAFFASATEHQAVLSVADCLSLFPHPQFPSLIFAPAVATVKIQSGAQKTVHLFLRDLKGWTLIFKVTCTSFAYGFAWINSFRPWQQLAGKIRLLLIALSTLLSCPPMAR